MPKELYIDENGNEHILSSSPSALSGLSDTAISNPIANQVLAYDSNGKVVNTDISNIPINYNDLSNKPTTATFIKVGYLNATTNSSGFCNVSGLSKRVIILSAWSNTGDVLIIPFSASGANDKGTNQWWFRVHNDSLQVRANFNFPLYYAYIELE